MLPCTDTLTYFAACPASKRYCQFRFITYGAKAELVYDLDHWHSSEQLIAEVEIPFRGVRETKTNITAAIQLANKVFDSSTHRRNVPKVIVIVAAAFRKDSDDPIPAANTFKDYGGVIITIDLQKGGIPVEKLKEIASFGYSISKGELNDSKLAKLLGIANCFCPDNYGPNGGDAPYYGCFRAFHMPTAWNRAVKACARRHNGMLVKVEDYNKADYIMDLGVGDPNNLWIGLKRKGYEFLWLDNSKLTHKDFNLWPKNVDPKKGDQCVSMYRHTDKQKIYWQTQPCNKGLPYVCQIAPCDSTNYCSEPLSAHRQMHRMYMHP
ncbi:hypothetical protein Aduo_007506 [Ancylostoma duodenale]